MRRARWGVAAILAIASPALAAEKRATAPPLTATEAELLKTACWWADDARPDVAKRRCAPPSELAWASARPGRFVERDGEWLVSLVGPCIGGCPGASFVARKEGARWKQLAFDNLAPVTDDCVTIRGLADGRDRVACLDGAGPLQGFMTEWLDVRDFAPEGGGSQHFLLQRDQGGECFFAEPPAKAEYVGDRLSDLAGAQAASETALTVLLTVRRAECDRSVEDPEKRAATKATHVLRFVKRGNDVVPDDATKALRERYGWTPEP